MDLNVVLDLRLQSYSNLSLACFIFTRISQKGKAYWSLISPSF